LISNDRFAERTDRTQLMFQSTSTFFPTSFVPTTFFPTLPGIWPGACAKTWTERTRRQARRQHAKRERGTRAQERGTRPQKCAIHAPHHMHARDNMHTHDGGGYNDADRARGDGDGDRKLLQYLHQVSFSLLQLLMALLIVVVLVAALDGLGGVSEQHRQRGRMLGFKHGQKKKNKRPMKCRGQDRAYSHGRTGKLQLRRRKNMPGTHRYSKLGKKITRRISDKILQITAAESERNGGTLTTPVIASIHLSQLTISISLTPTY